jgi:hypothetical protein
MAEPGVAAPRVAVPIRKADACRAKGCGKHGRDCRSARHYRSASPSLQFIPIYLLTRPYIQIWLGGSKHVGPDPGATPQQLA